VLKNPISCAKSANAVKKQGLGTRRFSACLRLFFMAAGLFQQPCSYAGSVLKIQEKPGKAARYLR